MQSLQYILLTNAAGAAVLAAVVWVVCFVCRRPAVCRALWILVLLKLLTPPLVTVPVNNWMASKPVAQLQPLPTPPSRAEPDLGEIGVASAIQLPVAVPQRSAPTWPQRVLSSLPIVCALGTLLFLTIGLIRVLMLLRLLADAPLAPESVQQLSRSVATRLGILKPP